MIFLKRGNAITIATRRLRIARKSLQTAIGHLLSSKEMLDAGSGIGQEPLAVEDACWSALIEGRKPWSIATETASACVVRMNENDWRSYWAADTAGKCQLIADSLTRRAKRAGAAGSPSFDVSIIPDMTLQRNEFQVSIEYARPRFDGESGCVVAEGSDAVTQRLYRRHHDDDSRQVHIYDEEQPSDHKTEKNPLSRLPCILVLDDGSVVEAYDGYTIGSDRGDCDLVFSSTDHPNLHREHAKLSNRGGFWTLLEIGWNGAQVLKKDGRVIKLDVNDGCGLEDGDLIVLGHDLVMTFYCSYYPRVG